MLKKMLALGCVAGLCLLAAADNNFSRRLVKLDKAAQPVKFALEKDDFVYFKVGHGADKTLQIGGAKSGKVILRGEEGFIELPAGTFEVRGNYGDSLEVRIVPYLVYDRMTGNFESEDAYELTVGGWRAGMWLYNWKWLEKYVLGAYNTIGWRGERTPEIAAWQAAGGRVYTNNTVWPDVEKCAAEWQKKMQENTCADGITLDEFVTPVRGEKKSNGEFGYTKPGYGFTPEHWVALKKFQTQLKARPAKIFAWVGMNWDANAEDNRPLFDVLIPNDDLVFWEAYCNSSAPEDIQSRIEERFGQFARIRPDIFHWIVFCPAVMEFSDDNAEIDFKVFLDRQLQVAATNPVTGMIRGIGMWTSPYFDPEMLLWYSKLVRHYGIEGKTEMLSKEYGYQLKPGLLVNPDFGEGAGGWQVTGKVRAASLRDEVIKKLKGSSYYPRSHKNLMIFEKTPGTKNRMEAPLVNLKAGKLYRVRFLITDPAQEKPAPVPFAVTVSNATVLSEEVRASSDFGGTGKKQPWNYVSVIFRYEGPDAAVLTLSDSGMADAPAELILDAVAVTPYYSPELQ